MVKKTELKVPDDLAQCQQMLVQMFDQMQQMQGQLDSLLRAKFGSKSETVLPGQLRLFSEIEDEQTEEPEEEVLSKPVTTSSHGRRKAAKELPRRKVIHEIPKEERACKGCSQELSVIGEEVSEQYDYSPASIEVIEHIRLKYACKSCGENVQIAKKPSKPIERGSASAGMLAYVATCKFADHLPLHRLEGIFKREGANIARSTMCDWLAATAELLRPLYERMKQRVLHSRIIWTDDTPVKMQDRSHENNIRQGRVWVYLGDKANPFSVFDFTDSRKRDGPKIFLDKFEGYLQADAFAGYDCIYAGGKVQEVACWAHARRKFFESLNSQAKPASEALRMIQELYSIEKLAAAETDEQRCKIRTEKSAPLLQQIKQWLDGQKLTALPKSPLGKAVAYTLNNWSALCRYVNDGELQIDNNRSERALRAIAVGRKNWMFCGSLEGGRTAAVLSTFISTCKQHSLNPVDYLRDVLERLSSGACSEIDELLPGNWQPGS